jgi:hypothetical protein
MAGIRGRRAMKIIFVVLFASFLGAASAAPLHVFLYTKCFYLTAIRGQDSDSDQKTSSESMTIRLTWTDSPTKKR